LASDTDDFLPELEDGQLVFRYRIPYEGKDVGRLYGSSDTRTSAANRSPLIQLNMGPLVGRRFREGGGYGVVLPSCT